MKKFILILFSLFLTNNIFAEIKVPGSGGINYWNDFEKFYKKQLKKSQKKKQKLIFYGSTSGGGWATGFKIVKDINDEAHEKVVMALRNLKQIYPDIVYTCVGYGDEEDNIKKLVKELDLEAQVMFFKDISNDLKNALIAKSNVFVMPSIIYNKSVEGFGIVYAEAGQYGIPSIGGKDGGAADAIDHEKTGLICDGNSLEEVYSTINKMLENKKYLEFGKNAQKYVTKFYWPKIIEEFKKILN